MTKLDGFDRGESTWRGGSCSTIFWALMVGLVSIIIVPYAMDNVVETRALLPKMLATDPAYARFEVTFTAEQYIGTCSASTKFDGFDIQTAPTTTYEKKGTSCVVNWICNKCAVVNYPVSLALYIPC